jgi:hypothetical protein
MLARTYPAVAPTSPPTRSECPAYARATAYPKFRSTQGSVNLTADLGY